MLRPHRLAVGFYDEDPATGKIVRTDRFELDVDGKSTVVAAAAGKKAQHKAKADGQGNKFFHSFSS